MICIVIKDCPDKRAAIDTFCSALAGSHAFINNDIIVTEEPKGTNRFMLLIGNSNNEDLTYEVSYHDLIPIKTE